MLNFKSSEAKVIKNIRKSPKQSVQQGQDLKAMLAQLRRSERRLASHYAVTRVLAQSATLNDAGQDILRAIGESFDWKLGMLWEVETQAEVLRFVDLWHAPQVEASAFCEKNRECTFPRGEGLIGQVWASGHALWIPDVARDSGFLRAPMAAQIDSGLHGWCGFPVYKGERMYGVIEFFTNEIRETDTEVLGMMADIGINIGQFVDRREAAEDLRRAEVRHLEEARLAEVARVLGDIGHDIKNMLMPVVMGASLLEEELDESYKQMPSPVVEAAAKSRELTKDLIAMIKHGSRRVQDRVKEFAESVKGPPRATQFGPCRLIDVVSSVNEMLRIPAEERGVILRVHGLESLPVIQADENRLFNAIYNLINNAIPETSSGGSVTVQGQTEPGGKQVVLSFIDTGKGIPPEVQKRLFTYQAISRKVGGTGLGTKIVKDVVETHGGSITVESELGKGTSFHITLPVEGPATRLLSTVTPQR